MIYVEAGSAFEANVEIGEAGLVGTLEYAVVDNDGNVVTGPTATLITENLVSGVPTGNYSRNDPSAPAAVGQYQILWSRDGSWDPIGLASEDMIVVVASTVPTAPPLVPAEEEGGPVLGPCTGWVSSEDIAECCPQADVGSEPELLDSSATAAAQLLFELSGRQFPGVCERVVRPCDESRSCGVQVLSRGHIVTWDGSIWTAPGGEPVCSCGGVSRVLLPNYPVREIIEVLVDGEALAPDEYRLDGWRWLTRMRDAEGDSHSWPRCQALDLPDDEEGTFSVRYAFGTNPPQPGIDAAKELACQVYMACPGSGATNGECILPSGVTRITRQGVTIELAKFRTWAFTRQNGWSTGLPLVDLFLSAYNPNGARRRSLIWSPDAPRFPEEVGTIAGS